jgi:hypothetical protein
MQGRTLWLTLALGALTFPALTHAADCGAPGKAKIFDRPATSGNMRLIYRSGPAPCLDKGPAGSLATLSGTFDIAYIDPFGSPGGGFVGSSRGAFVMPPPWHVNKPAMAKYLNRDAPTGGGLKIGGFKQAKNVRISTRNLGDGPSLAVRTAPPGPSGILAIATINNAANGTTTRVCTRWAVGLGSVVNYQVVDGGTGVKLFLKNGVPSPCNVAPIPTTTTTSTTTSTSTSSSSSTTSSTSTSTTSTTSTSTSTLPGTQHVYTFTTGLAVGTCGQIKNGGAAGTTAKTLTCGGLNIGGGASTVFEGPTPANAPTRFNAACLAGTCTVTARTAAQTGSNTGLLRHRVPVRAVPLHLERRALDVRHEHVRLARRRYARLGDRQLRRLDSAPVVRPAHGERRRAVPALCRRRVPRRHQQRRRVHVHQRDQRHLRLPGVRHGPRLALRGEPHADQLRDRVAGHRRHRGVLPVADHGRRVRLPE